MIRHVVDIYAAAELKVKTAMMDMEFDSLKPLLPQIVVNTTAANEHVVEMERRIRIVIECAWGTLSILPFKKYP